jgi:hypothetical protein
MAISAKRKARAPRRKGGTDQEPETVIFEYIKSQAFRSIHADGAIGSVTPSGNLHIAFYNERAPIPRMMVHEKNIDGSLGTPIPEQTVTRPGIVREMDVDVILSPKALDALLDWLVERKKDLAKIERQQKKKSNSRSRKKT